MGMVTQVAWVGGMGGSIESPDRAMLFFFGSLISSSNQRSRKLLLVASAAFAMQGNRYFLRRLRPFCGFEAMPRVQKEAGKMGKENGLWRKDNTNNRLLA